MIALCLGAGDTRPDLWFSDVEAEREEAKRICDRCTQAPGCLRGALERGETAGVWAGMWLGAVELAEPVAWETAAITAPEHGSRTTYLRCTDGDDGGKCAACRGANAAYQQGYRDHGPTVTRPGILSLFEQLTIGANA